MMKFLKIISLILVILSKQSLVQAQSQNNSLYSIGLKAFSFEETTKILNEVRTSNANARMFGNGLIFKINDNQISYRFQGYSFKDKDYSFTNTCKDCETVNGEYKSVDLKMGFERALSYTRLQPIYGAEVGYRKVNFDGESQNATTKAYLYDTTVEKNGATLYPFIGLKFNIFKQLTISAESGLSFYYNYSKEVKSNKNNELISQNGFERMEYTTRPLGLLSIEFNFGEN